MIYSAARVDFCAPDAPPDDHDQRSGECQSGRGIAKRAIDRSCSDIDTSHKRRGTVTSFPTSEIHDRIDQIYVGSSRLRMLQTFSQL